LPAGGIASIVIDSNDDYSLRFDTVKEAVRKLPNCDTAKVEINKRCGFRHPSHAIDRLLHAEHKTVREARAATFMPTPNLPKVGTRLVSYGDGPDHGCLCNRALTSSQLDTADGLAS
jgi:hypothetical protein